jgi:hypothetical protein
MTGPTTDAGFRYHDAAWPDEERSGVETGAMHTYHREGCSGCAWIAEIEAEARAAALREVAEKVRDLIDTVAFLSSVAASGERLDEHDVARVQNVIGKARAILTEATGASE